MLFQSLGNSTLYTGTNRRCAIPQGLKSELLGSFCEIMLPPHSQNGPRLRNMHMIPCGRRRGGRAWRPPVAGEEPCTTNVRTKDTARTHAHHTTLTTLGSHLLGRRLLALRRACLDFLLQIRRVLVVMSLNRCGSRLYSQRYVRC